MRRKYRKRFKKWAANFKGISPIIIVIAIFVLAAGGVVGMKLGESARNNLTQSPQNTPIETSSETPTPSPTPVPIKTTTPTKKPTTVSTPKTTPTGTPVYGIIGSTPVPSGPDCSMYDLSGQTTDIKVLVCPSSGAFSYSPITYVQTQNGCKVLDNNYTDKLSRYATTTTSNNCRESIFGNLRPGPYSVWATKSTGENLGSQSATAVFGSLTTVTITANP